MIKFGYPLRNKIFDVLKVFMYIYYIKLNEISDVGSNFYLFYNIWFVNVGSLYLLDLML